MGGVIRIEIRGGFFMKNGLVPNDGVIVQRARLAVAMALKKKRILGQPIARFDPRTRSVYLEYGDGTCVEFGKASLNRYGAY